MYDFSFFADHDYSNYSSFEFATESVSFYLSLMFDVTTLKNLDFQERVKKFSGGRI